MSTLKMEMKVGDSVSIGDNVVITMEEKSGNIARLSFEADKSIPINRVINRTPDSHHAATIGLGGSKST